MGRSILLLGLLLGLLAGVFLGMLVSQARAEGNHSREESAEGMAAGARNGIEGPFGTILARNVWAGIFGRGSYYEPGGRSQARDSRATNGMLGHI
jgi:DNA invertase Pin-like site-specific DNA recombinase